MQNLNAIFEISGSDNMKKISIEALYQLLIIYTDLSLFEERDKVLYNLFNCT